MPIHDLSVARRLDPRAQGAVFTVAALVASLVVLASPLYSTAALPMAHEEARAAVSNTPSSDVSASGSIDARGIADRTAGAGLVFVENQGQMDSRVRYYIQGADASLYFTDRGVRMSLSAEGMSEPAKDAGNKRWVMDHAFLGADSVRPVASRRSEMTVSYFKGDRADWHTGLPTFERIVYRQVWPGIDLVYTGTGQALKYDLIVHAGADPGAIALAYRHVRSVQPTAAGALRVTTPIGSFTDSAPIAYQERGGARVQVPAAFETSGRTYGFQLGAYDTSRTLVIDPEVVIYAGYIGGSGSDIGYGIAVDSGGNAYVTGSTASDATTFPETGGPELAYQGAQDAFVAKVRADGSGLVYAGYIGGSGSDTGTGIAVDSSGNAYVTGETSSSEATFPDAVGPDTSHNGSSDTFVAKVNAAGTGLAYAGYIGGTGAENGIAIAVDSSGSAYVTGSTDSSAGFPAVVGPDLLYNGGTYDAFVAKVKADGSGLVYAGYIGGSGRDISNAIAVDSSGNAYVTGSTDTSAGFPAAIGPNLTHSGGIDAFVAKVPSDGSALSYAGYIGGAGTDVGRGIAVDSSGNAYVTGVSASDATTFPVFGGPDLVHNGGSDAFVAKVAAAGTGLTYAGYIGGSLSDEGYGIAVDSDGNAYVTGTTGSDATTFPKTVGPALTLSGGTDAFVAKIGETFGLTVTNAGTGSGTVTSVPAGISCTTDCTESYSDGTSVTLTAAADSGSSFSGWTDACSGTSTCTLTMTAARAATATFNRIPPAPPPQDTLSITKSGSGAGTVTSAPAGIDCGSDCTQNYSSGTSVTLSAVEEPQSIFSGWSGDCSGTGTCTVTMNATRAVTATFEETFTLTTTTIGSGVGTVTSTPAGIDCGSGCTKSYASGTSVTLTATADPGSFFSGWSGDCSGTNTCTVTMDAMQAVSATFDQTFILTTAKNGLGSGVVTSAPGGIDCGTGCSATYADGSSVTLTASPDADSTFDTWTGCDSFAGTTCTLTMSVDRTVSLTFGTTDTCAREIVTIQVEAPNLTTLGTAGDDVIKGTGGVDKIDGLGGNDIICGLGSGDLLLGGAGNDVLHGNVGNDTLRGGDGNDKLFGGVGNFGPGDDNLYGGDGQDRLLGDGGDDYLEGGRGDDHIFGNHGTEELHGNAGDDVIDGGRGDDILVGGSGRDNLHGRTNDDTIYGGSGNDTMFGNVGADTLDGGAGRDACDGGIGINSAASCENSVNFPRQIF